MTETFTNTNLALVAVLILGMASCTAETDIHPDLASSIAWYTGAAGHIDDDKARTLLEKAAAEEDTLATMWIARVHSTGRMGFEENRILANETASSVIGQVEQLARTGNAEANFLMGTAYAEALGKPLDPELAAEWYKRAAESGHMLAQHNLGNIYASGTGVPQNNSMAIKWWLLAAEQGDAIPQFRLAEMLESGTGITQNHQQAIHWYSESAAREGMRARQLHWNGSTLVLTI